MSELQSAGTWEEVPAFFPAGDETLFGILCRPEGREERTGVLISSGGLTGTSTVGRNQMFVRLGRRFAAEGLAAMRFDYHGIGESTGVVEEFKLDAPQPFVADIIGAARYLERQGVDRLFLVGKCFGSRMALAATSSIEQLQGVVLIGAPIRDFGRGERTTTKLAVEFTPWDYLRRALRPATIRSLRHARKRKAYVNVARAKLQAMKGGIRDRSPASDGGPHWVSPDFIEPLEALVARDIPIQLLYGDEDEFYEEFQRAASRHPRLRSLVESPLVDIATMPGRVGDFVQSQVQEQMLDTACSWICQHRDLAKI